MDDQIGNMLVETPEEPVDRAIGWGSDVAAEVLRRLDIPFIALTPGASFRGFHDSLVNYLGNEMPRMLLCLHEEHAVAMAQGYAKATGRAMAVALHSNVGLMHATMAIFNAWCDRQPMLMIGATGPVDAALRRPWIDWLHTSQDQGALIRSYVKWDDQPGSVAALPESLLRAWRLTMTQPTAPVYVCLDARVQEEKVDVAPAIPDVTRFAPPPASAPDADALTQAVAALAKAQRPLILMGRGSRSEDAWNTRLALAEKLGAGMISDLKVGSMVPSDHPLHVGQPINKLGKAGRQALQEADVILSLGWVDLGGVLRQAYGADLPTATVIHAGQDEHLHNGWGKEHFGLPPIDIALLGDPDAAAEAVLKALPDRAPAQWITPRPPKPEPAAVEGVLTLRDVARTLKTIVGDEPVTFPALARAWPVELWPHRDPLAYLGKDGGGGVGSGPGLCLGAALALRDSGRLVVGVLGDGDTLMGINAFWTAVRYALPLVIIVANNRSYYNDELHQEGVARTRGRNVANRWIGQRIEGPIPDIAKLAEGQGMAASGPIKTHADLEAALRKAVDAARAGRPYLVDVHIDPGHGRDLTESMAERSMAGTPPAKG